MRCFILLILAVCCTGSVQADWIMADFSERAQIDSLSRFLVMRDTEQETGFGTQILLLGDLTGQGASSILITRYGPSDLNIQPSFLFHGGSNPNDQADAVFGNILSSIGLIGDVNADGFVDLSIPRIPRLPGQEFELLFGGPEFDDEPDFVIPNIWSRPARAADLDGDGALDLPLSVNLAGWYVHIYRMDSLRDTVPEYVLPDTSKDFGNNLTTLDFNGDTWTDLAVAAYENRDTFSFVRFYWGGPGFDTIPDFEINNPALDFGRTLLPLGDFNADGYEDLLIAGGQDRPYGIYFGGPTYDDTVDIIVNQARGSLGYFPPTSADVIGDFNSDGHPDFVLGYAGADYQAHIYLGGPTSDTNMIADIFIDRYMMPGGQTVFGREVAGIGDFNSDGIVDVAVKSQTADGPDWWAEVNFFAGYDPTATDVPVEYEATLPSIFSLHQNYPNPFNMSTTLEFALPHRGEVSLVIFNILGEHVCTLVDSELSAGSYKVVWNGKDHRGKVVASGVYLYTLKAGEHSVTKKMLLLK